VVASALSPADGGGLLVVGHGEEAFMPKEHDGERSTWKDEGALVDDGGALRSDELYRTYAPQAFRRARRVLRCDADAHEVVNDVFLSLLERPRQYGGQCAFGGFLRSAVTHACLNRLRHRATCVKLTGDANAGALFPRATATDPEEASTLRSVLARLPKQLADVAVYYYLYELTHDDIARILGCSRRHVGDLVMRLEEWARDQNARDAPAE
jgi:RNA polymerase sigma-70 factor (ECF subfamily)